MRFTSWAKALPWRAFFLELAFGIQVNPANCLQSWRRRSVLRLWASSSSTVMSPNDPDRPAFITRVCSSRSLTISLQISFTLSWSIELLNAEVHARFSQPTECCFRRSSRTGRLAANFLIRSLCSWRASCNCLKMSLNSEGSGDAIAWRKGLWSDLPIAGAWPVGTECQRVCAPFDRVHTVVT